MKLSVTLSTGIRCPRLSRAEEFGKQRLTTADNNNEVDQVCSKRRLLAQLGKR